MRTRDYLFGIGLGMTVVLGGGLVGYGISDDRPCTVEKVVIKVP